MDITKFMNWFIDAFLSLFQFVYNTLDSIKFGGISLLQYIITIFVLIPILGILFTLVTSEKVWTASSEKRQTKKEK